MTDNPSAYHLTLLQTRTPHPIPYPHLNYSMGTQDPDLAIVIKGREYFGIFSKNPILFEFQLIIMYNEIKNEGLNFMAYALHKLGNGLSSIYKLAYLLFAF